MPEAHVVEFDRVTVRFGARRVLDGVSLRVAPRDRVALGGESGAGKSTLLRLVVGAVRPESGRVLFEGEEVTAATVASVRRRIAFVGQEPVMGADTVGEALLLPFTFRTHRQERPAQDSVRRVLERVRLSPGLLEQPCDALSGGERQRVAVARAVLLGKRVFLVDEVTSALDAESRDMVMDLILAPGHTVLSISHDPEWTARCHRRVVLGNGVLGEDGGHADR
jgi:putative ABC transport system ATP-binding protein